MDNQIDERYQRGKVYKIECLTTGECYVGSTIETLVLRLRKHTNKRNCMAIQIIDRDNFEMTCLELYPCDNRVQLEFRERWHYDHTPNIINKQRPRVTDVERVEKRAESVKSYYERHSEEINTQRKAREEAYTETRKEEDAAKQQEKHDCPCGGRYTHTNKLKHERTQMHRMYLATLIEEN